MPIEALQQICADLLVADASETEFLRDAQTRLSEMRDSLVEAAPEARPALDAALALLQRIVGGDSPDPSADLASTVEAMEAIRQAGEQKAGLADEDNDDIAAEFLAGHTAVLDEIEDHVLSVEQDPSEENLNQLRGRIHTIKGEAGVLGYADVASACHEIEELLTDGEAPSPRVLFSLVDWLRLRLGAEMTGDERPEPFDMAQAAEDGEVSAEVAKPAVDEAPVVEEPAEEPVAEAAQDGAPTLSPEEVEVPEAVLKPQAVAGDPELLADFVAESREHLEEVDAQLLALESDPTDAEAMASVFRAFHTVKGVASFMDLNVIKHLAHSAETVLDLARKNLLDISGAPVKAAFEANDVLKTLITDVEEAAKSGDNAPVREVVADSIRTLESIASAVPTEALEGGGPSAASTPQAASEPEQAAEPAPSAGSQPAGSSAPKETKSTVTPAAKKASSGGQKAKASGGNTLRESIKVDAGRLDALVDMIGELVIAEAMVSQSDELDMAGMSRLPALLGHMDKITRELQELAMSLRMVPIRSTFRRMARLARDVAEKTGRQVELVTRGEDTELDKTVVDAIGDPLIHMIRNAVDHGIESDQAERIRAGKPAKGRIELRAFHQSGSIYIEIQDDGRGLDTEAILAKARERGIVNETDSLSEQQIHNLIFAPGFSTASQVTEVSGRGVGMDVVRRNIEAMRGRTEIRSKLGEGSVFSIRLPLTLAIIDGMVVRLSGERYVLPTISIVRMLRPDEIKLTEVFGRGSLLQVGEEVIPLFHLDEVFGIERDEPAPPRQAAVVVEHDGLKFAFVVDHILGQQQIVIKPLGPALSHLTGLAGGAIMPDGHVGLIIDIAGVVRSAARDDGSHGDNCSPRVPVAASSENPE